MGLGPISLRAKAILFFAAIALYLLMAGVVVSWQRSQMLHIIEDLETLNQVESTLARVNTFASQAVLKINEGYFSAEPRQIAEAIELDLESITAGVRSLGGWYPAGDEMLRRLEAAYARAARTPARSAVVELRSTMNALTADLDPLARSLRTRHERMWTEYRTNYDSVTLIAAILFLLGLTAFGAAAMVFFRRLTWDLRVLAERAVELVRGYRGEPLRVARRDEVGDLMDAVNRMQHLLREREQQVEIARQQRFHQEKMAAIGSLAAAVAHEINNPIAAIEGVAQSIGGTVGLACPGRGVDCHPELILEHTRRIAGITRQLSQFAAPGAAEAEWTDVNGLVRATCAFMSYDPRFRAVRIEQQLDGSVPAAWAVGDHLTQVVMNLLINAADALAQVPPGERRIDIASASEGDFVRVTIADNGPGMPPEVLARAFDEGFTTKREGSGIGLFLCRSLLQRGGGNIAVESDVGKGTRVTLWLPCLAPQDNLPQ